MVWFFNKDEYTDDWNSIEKISKIKVDILGLKNVNGVPSLELEGYDKYMFQKYLSAVIMGTGQDFLTELAGFQIGGFKEEVGWLVIDINFKTGKISTALSKELTSIAIKEGVVVK